MLNKKLCLISNKNHILKELVDGLAIEGAFIILENSKCGCQKESIGTLFKNSKEQTKLEEYYKSNQKFNLEGQKTSRKFRSRNLYSIYIKWIYLRNIFRTPFFSSEI